MKTTAPSFRLGPDYTPAAVRKLIIFTLCLSAGSAFINPFFTEIFGIFGPQQWFSLSWWGIEHYLLWQPISYLFIQSSASGGIGISYLIGLLFNMYILWVMGSDICQRVDEKSFTKFYFICGVLSGLLTLLLMPVLGQYAALAGPTSSILAILIVWAFLNPEQELLLFFLVPVKAKWISLGILAFALLSSLSNFQFIYFFHYLFGAVIGYLYALVVWGIHSPFPFLYPFELSIVRAAQKVCTRLPLKRKKTKAKVINIRTGEPDNDEAFVDAMLEKISKYGENSLSFSERKRMDSISKNKSQN